MEEHEKKKGKIVLHYLNKVTIFKKANLAKTA